MTRHLPVAAPLLLALVAVLATVAFDLQLTAERYVGTDLVYREARPDALAYPVMDPSPWSIAVPTDRWLHDSLRAGELPLWDTSQSGGYSPATQGNVGVFFPLRWLTVLVPIAQAPTALAIMSVALAYLGFYLLCVALGLRRSAGVFAGATYAFSTIFLVQLLYDGGAVMLFLPWLLWADVRLAESPTVPRFAITAVLFAGGFLSGHVMVLFVVFLGAALFHVVRAREAGWRHSIRFAAASVCGLALAAFAMIPFAVEMGSLWLYKLEADQGATFSALGASEWLRAVSATAIDASSDTTLIDTPQFYVFLGPVVAALALGGAAFAGRSPSRRTWLAFAVVSFCVSVPGPWMAPLGELPPLRWVRGFYAITLLAAAASLMAAVTVDHLARTPRLERLLPLVVAALLLAGPGLTVARTATVVRPVPAFELPSTGASRFLDVNAPGTKLTASWGQVHLPHLAPWSGYDDVRILLVGFDRRLHRWWELVDPNVLDHSYPTTRMTPTPGSPLLPMFGVRWFLEGKLPHHVFMTATGPADPFAQFPPRGATPGVEVAYEDPGLRIYYLPNARPLAYAAANVVTVPDIDAAAAWIDANPERVSGSTVVESDAPVPESSSPAGFALPDAAVTVERAEGARVELTTTSETETLVVLNHRFDTGWRAHVDGEPAEILPANIVARGVVVPAGEHRITMRYCPPGMGVGALLSAVTLFGLCGAILWDRRRRSDPASSA